MAPHFNHIYADILNQCIDQCQRCIDYGQEVMDKCSTSVNEECAPAFGSLMQGCRQLIETCSRVVQSLNKHMQECSDNRCKEALKQCSVECDTTIHQSSQLMQECKATLPCNEAVLAAIEQWQRCSQACKACLE